MVNFELQSAPIPGTRARAARIELRNSTALTPMFMPVGTRGTVRHLKLDSLAEISPKVILANTYHLMLQPGTSVLKKFGGLHKFMKWNSAILTDSGGFQIFSLDDSRKISEEGALFKSYWDGSTHMLSPEYSLDIQSAIGSDIAMVLDVCVPSTVEHKIAQEAMERTHRWAKRSLKHHNPEQSQGLFGIVQGACHKDLRIQSAQFLSSLDFDGLAIGGLAVGETKSEREDFTELVTEYLPVQKPRYLMGVGTPLDLLEAVHRGVDMFDCILPGALSEQGVVYTHNGKLRVSRSVYKFIEAPLDPLCNCSVCATYSIAYIHHLKKSREPLGTQLIAHHNIFFFCSLMTQIRTSILNGTFLDFYNSNRARLGIQDPDFPPAPPPNLRKERQRARDLEIAKELNVVL